MKNIIPYEHDIEFDTKIAEITSISLEHEDKITDQGIEGEFIISGDYKAHSISVNKENFNYRLPFSLELPERVINDTIEYNITDFTYDIKNDNILTVKIELEVSYDEMEEKEEEDIIEVLEDTNREEEIEETKEENEIEIPINSNVEIGNKPENIVMDNVINNIDTYITYHVYNIKENDNLEDIAKNYHSTKDLIMEYNNVDEIKEGMKIIVPELIDE